MPLRAVTRLEVEKEAFGCPSRETKPPIDGSLIVITGASSVIGEELAHKFAPRARQLVLVARRVARMAILRASIPAGTPGGEIGIEPSDLADIDASETLADRITGEYGAPDIFVNCAGLGDRAPYDKADWKKCIG